jgi:hypothetical protein
MIRWDSSVAKTAGLSLLLTGMLVIVGCGGSNSGSTPSNMNPTQTVDNSVPLAVGFGPNGNAGGYVDGVFTTVTVCAHGSTSNCQVVPDVLVDTGSVGLRILSSAFTSIQPTALGTVQDSSKDQIQECIQYGDSSYSWGPIWTADVQIGSETASNMGIQVIGGNASNPTFATAPSQCLSTPVNTGIPNGGNEDTVATLGANGILGVGPYPLDCGSYCTSGGDPTQTGYPYYVCPTNEACKGTTTSVQAGNPVAFFSSSDNNGVMIVLGSVPAQGAVSASGTMYFGIGTQSNNSLGSATLYALNTQELLPTVKYNGVSYTSLNVVDTGTNSLSVSDASTLGIADCADNGYYCPGSTLTLSNVQISGNGNVGSGRVTLSIANADQLFGANPTFAAYNNIGSDGGTGPSNDSFDFGLPFFLGKTVFVGIAGKTVPSGASAPNGFYAF